MIGLLSSNGDLQIVNNDIALTYDVEVLENELFNFLHIKAAHIVDDKIIFQGECIEDQNLGLDHIILTESENETIKSYVTRQILRYFSDRIKEMIEINVSKDYKSRELIIDFTIKTIYNENIKMGVKI